MNPYEHIPRQLNAQLNLRTRQSNWTVFPERKIRSPYPNHSKDDQTQLAQLIAFPKRAWFVCRMTRHMSGNIFDLPRCSGAASVVENGRWYIFAGFNGTEWVSDLYEITLDTLCLRKLNADTSCGISGRANCGLFIMNGSLHVFGGESGSFYMNDMYRLDLSIKKLDWVKVQTAADQPVPVPRTRFASGVVDGKFVLFGGKAGKRWISDTWEYDGCWKQICDYHSPSGRSGCSSVVVTAGLLVFGGNIHNYNENAGCRSPYYREYNDLWLFKSGTWSEIEILGISPSVRYLHSGAKCNDNSFVAFGGLSGNGPLGCTWKFELLESQPPRGMWHQQQGQETGRSELVACVHHDHLLVLGGCSRSRLLSDFHQIKLPRPLTIMPRTPQTNSNFLADIEKMLRDFPDVILSVDDGETPVFSYLLAARSEFFKALLFGEMSESNQLRKRDDSMINTEDSSLPRVRIERIRIRTMLTVLRYICTDMLEETDPEFLLLVLEASIRFLLANLTDNCTESLCRVINEESATRFLLTASKYGAEALKKQSLDYIARNAKEIKARYPETLKDLLSDPELVLQLFLRKSELV